MIFQPLTVSHGLSTKYSSLVLRLSRRLCTAVLLYPSSSECLDGPCFAAAANQQSRKESKASLAGVLRFLLRHVMGGSERAKREEITRREQGRKVLRASRRNRRVLHSEPQCSVAWKLEVEQNEHLERPKARKVKTRGSSEAGSDNICRHRRGHLPAAVLCATT